MFISLLYFEWLKSFPTSFFDVMSVRKRKLLELDDLKRRVSHVTAAGLSSVIKAIKRTGLPELDDRADIREARDFQLNDPTPYGPISTELLCIRHVDGKPPEKLLIAHPCAFLWKAFKDCDPFAEFFKERLAKHPCSYDKPWSLILYCDEITPGDAIGGKKLRKFQAVYYSFLEFGPLALNNEKMWFTLTTTRSIEVVKMPGGMALVFGTILHELFIDGSCSEIGITLNKDGEAPIEFYFTITIFVMDGAAHKATWHCKGDSGSKLCLLCRNIFAAASEVVDEDGTNMLRCNACTHAELDLATHEDLVEAVTRINDAHDTLLPGDDHDEFDKLQQALGFTYQPYNLLGDAELEAFLDVPKQFLHDWMHMIFVSGVFNLVLHYVLEAIREVKIVGSIYALLRDYIRLWTWPKRLKHTKLHELFADSRRSGNVDAGRFRCDASEGLSLYLVIAQFFTKVVLPMGVAADAVRCYFSLCDVIDCMVCHARGLVDKVTIRNAVETFLARFDTAFGMEWSTPKFHWMLHFSDHVQFVSCWPLERKHKVPKAYASDVRNTRVFERSVMHEVVAEQLHDLADPDTFIFNRHCIIHGRPASKLVKKFVCEALHLDADLDFSVEHAFRSHPSDYVYCSQGDVCLFEQEADKLDCGEILHNLSVEGEPCAIVNAWEFVESNDGVAMWLLQDNPILVHGGDILDVVIWTKYDSRQVSTLLPRQYCT